MSPPSPSPAPIKPSSSDRLNGDTPNDTPCINDSTPTTTHRHPYGPPGLRGLFTNRTATLCAAFAALGGLLFGYDQGVVSVILTEQQFLTRFPRVDSGAAGFWKGLLTAILQLGAFLGALNQGWIADKFSRKFAIVGAVGVFVVGSVLQTASNGYAMLTVGRFVGGLGIGALSCVAPLYISEISPPEIRGALLVLEEFSIVSGIVVAFWITYGTRYMHGEWAWRLPFLLQMVPGFFLGAGMPFLPFSPRWLVSKGREQEALQALARLRGLGTGDGRVRGEWRDIRAEVAFHKETSKKRHPALQRSAMGSRFKLEVASWVDCFRRGCWRRTHVGVMIMFFQQFGECPFCNECARKAMPAPPRPPMRTSIVRNHVNIVQNVFSRGVPLLRLATSIVKCTELDKLSKSSCLSCIPHVMTS